MYTCVFVYFFLVGVCVCIIVYLCASIHVYLSSCVLVCYILLYMCNCILVISQADGPCILTMCMQTKIQFTQSQPIAKWFPTNKGSQPFFLSFLGGWCWAAAWPAAPCRAAGHSRAKKMMKSWKLAMGAIAAAAMGQADNVALVSPHSAALESLLKTCMV